MIREDHGEIIDRETALGEFRVAAAKCLSYGVNLTKLLKIVMTLGKEIQPEQESRLEIINAGQPKD